MEEGNNLIVSHCLVMTHTYTRFSHKRIICFGQEDLWTQTTAVCNSLNFIMGGIPQVIMAYHHACLLAWILGLGSTFHSLPAKSAHAHQFHIFRPGSVHNGSASRDDCGRMFPDELHMSLFPSLIYIQNR